MRIKILILGLIFLILVVCKPGDEDIKSPYSPPVIIETQVELRVLLDIDDVWAMPPSWDDPWAVNVGVYVDGVPVEEIDVTLFISYNAITVIIPSEKYQWGSTHEIKFRLNAANFPAEWHDGVRWRLYVEVRALDERCEMDSKTSTGFFWAWKVGTWKECPTSGPCKFRIE